MIGGGQDMTEKFERVRHVHARWMRTRTMFSVNRLSWFFFQIFHIDERQLIVKVEVVNVLDDPLESYMKVRYTHDVQCSIQIGWVSKTSVRSIISMLVTLHLKPNCSISDDDIIVMCCEPDGTDTLIWLVGELFDLSFFWSMHMHVVWWYVCTRRICHTRLNIHAVV